MKERHVILQNSIGALPTEVTAARWLLLNIVLIPALLLAFTGISAWLFKLQNFKFHPFRVIVDPDENPFKECAVENIEMKVTNAQLFVDEEEEMIESSL